MCAAPEIEARTSLPAPFIRRSTTSSYRVTWNAPHMPTHCYLSPRAGTVTKYGNRSRDCGTVQRVERYHFPPMLGPASDQPEGSYEWGECYGNELDYHVDRFMMTWIASPG